MKYNPEKVMFGSMFVAVAFWLLGVLILMLSMIFEFVPTWCAVGLLPALLCIGNAFMHFLYLVWKEF